MDWNDVDTNGLIQLAIEAFPNGILLIDPQGTIALVNREVEHRFGYARAELIGRGVERLLPEAKPQQGYDFGIVDITVDGKGVGVGTMSPAAKVTVKQGVFVVDEYSGELIRLSDVKKVK